MDLVNSVRSNYIKGSYAYKKTYFLKQAIKKMELLKKNMVVVNPSSIMFQELQDLQQILMSYPKNNDL